MARKRQLHQYPKEYFILFRSAAEKTIRVACDSPSQASSLRNELYAFRSVLKDHAEDDDRAHALAKQAFSVTLSVTDRTLTAEPIRGEQ